MMLREERLTEIMKVLERNQRVSSAELAELLHVSDDTIRRDLNELAGNGLLKKVHGGAIPKTSSPYNLKERFQIAVEEKAHLAQKAIPFLKEGQVIFMDNGTTNVELAKVLPAGLKLTVFTNSLPVASQLVEHPDVELFFVGGKVLKYAQTTYGHEVNETLGQIRLDVCFLGVCSIHPQIGATIPDREESLSKRKIVDASQKVIALVTANKIDRAENFIVCPYEKLDVMITDDRIAEETLASYKNKGVQIR